MGISRDSRHKRAATGAQRAHYRKKRKFDLGRQAANTRLGARRVHEVRVRGGNRKFRALRLETGNYSWGSEAVTRKSRILGVVYNATNNELVRTNTLVKGCIVQIDATPFRQWWESHYGEVLGKKRKAAAAASSGEKSPTSKSKHVQAKLKSRQSMAKVEGPVDDQFVTGRLYAMISSRPGQVGRADGFILEGEELAFYLRKLHKK